MSDRLLSFCDSQALPHVDCAWVNQALDGGWLNDAALQRLYTMPCRQSVTGVSRMERKHQPLAKAIAEGWGGTWEGFDLKAPMAMRLFLQHGVDVNRPFVVQRAGQDFQVSVLHCAIDAAQPETVAFLLSHGADASRTACALNAAGQPVGKPMDALEFQAFVSDNPDTPWKSVYLTKMRDKPRPSGRGRKARAPQVPLAV